MQLRRHAAAPFHGRRGVVTSTHRACPLLAAAGVFAVLAIGPGAWAQEATVYIGGGGHHGDAVHVDLSVLDDLDASRGPVLRPPGSAPAVEHITLIPPGHQAHKAASHHRTASKAKAAMTRKAPAPTVAKAAAPAKNTPTAENTTTTTTVKASSAATPAMSVSDLPPPPPEPVEITMPPPTPLTAATAKTAAVTPDHPAPASKSEAHGSKPMPASTPVMAAKKPPVTAPAERPPAVEPELASTPASSAVPSAVPSTATSEPLPIATPVAASTAPPAPRAEPKAAEPAPTRTASLAPAPTAGSSKTNQPTRIAFTGDGAALPEPAKGDLKQIAGSLAKDPELRVQVMAYASGSKDASKARRLSLSRALAVRSFLIDQGVGSTRIDVRALGNTAQNGPSDRVDLMVLSR